MAIGTIAVNIVARTDKFIAGLNSAKTRLGKFTKSIGVLHTAVAGLSIAGFGSMVARTIAAGDALFDTANKIGIATDALGALRFAAEQTGTSAASLDRALVFMNKNIGLAGQGAQAQVKAFANVGLSLSQLQGMKPEETFLAVADAINSIESATDQAAAVQQIFGRAGAELLPFLRTSQEEIVKLGDKAAATGGLISTEVAQQMSDLADKWKEIQLSAEGMKTQAALFATPALAAGAETGSKTFQLLRITSLAFENAALHLMRVAGYDTSHERGGIGKRARQILGNEAGGGPLKMPIEKTEKNTAVTNKKLDKVVEAVKNSSGDNIELVQMGMR